MTEAATYVDTLVDAFIHTALIKRYIGPMQVDRMREMIAERQLRTVDDLRKWLQMGEGMSPKLSRALLNTLPPLDKETISHYKTLTHLADGGMGSVWLCADEQNELVVLKTLKGNLSTQSDEFGLRFERESRIMKTLKHNNTVWCLDAGRSDDGSNFMVLEFIDTGDLKDLTEQFTKLTEALALCIMYQVTCGLCVADNLNLIHRDIKPANIFITKGGCAKLADFGIARSTEENRTMLTMQGALVGSPLYMSPEQVFADADLDIRSDIYALGCVLFYMLTGNPPYTSSGHLQEVLHMHCEAAIPDVREQRPEISAATQGIIEKCMAKERGDRPDTPNDLLAIIGAALKEIGLEITNEETEFGPISPSAEKASADLVAAMRAQIPEETIAQNLNILNAGAANSDDATIAANLNSNDATIAVDLSAQDDATIAADFGGDTQATMAANLNPAQQADDTLAANWNDDTLAAGNAFEAADQAAPQVSDTISTQLQQQTTQKTPNNFVDTLMATVNPDGKPATDVTIAEQPATRQQLNGDLNAAMSCPWVNLTPSNPGEPMAYMFYAKHDILMGKLRDAPIDICLRNYPVMIHKAACQRISRQHLRCIYDIHNKTLSTVDIGSGNGTLFEGMALSPNKPQNILAGNKAQLLVADAVELEIEAHPCSSMPVYVFEDGLSSSKQNAFGIDTHHSLDCATISRPSNRPELAYAMVLRKVSIGGNSAHIKVNGIGDEILYTFALFNGRWIWAQGGTPDVWMPLQDGDTFQIANRHLIARAGSYQDFN